MQFRTLKVSPERSGRLNASTEHDRTIDASCKNHCLSRHDVGSTCVGVWICDRASLFVYICSLQWRGQTSVHVIYTFSEHILVSYRAYSCRPDVSAKLMPVCTSSLRHSACCCHRTKRVCVMSFSHLCLGFPLLLFPATILPTIVASNVAKVFKFLTSYKIIQPVRW